MQTEKHRVWDGLEVWAGEELYVGVNVHEYGGKGEVLGVLACQD